MAHGIYREDRGQRSIIESSLGYMLHRPIQSIVPGGSTKYPMTQIGGFGLSGKLNSFPEGVNAFQNARGWAMNKRDELIAAVNARMQKMATTAVSVPPASSGSTQT